MPTNDFKPFATAGGANVMSQSDYIALAARLSGFTAGVATSAQLNKAWRQACAIAAMVGQFTADRSQLDALDDGDLATLQAHFETALGRRLRNTIIQTAAGTYTWTKPAWCVEVEIEAVGGGGGAGGAASSSGGSSYAGGGGGGGYARKRTAASGLGATESYTVGAAGTGSSYNGGTSIATAGGTSSFGSLVSCTGGAAGFNQPFGSTGAATSGAVGGTGTGGDLNIPGGAGDSGYRYSATFGKAGNGGSSMFSPIAIGSYLSQAGIAGAGPGGGGSGASSFDGSAGTGSFSGGNGKPGLIIIREYA